MKLRRFLIVLFAILMVFAFASCKNEPEVKPAPEPVEDPWELYPYKDYKPTANQVQVITITEGVETDYYNRDKLKIEWEEPVQAGDVVTLKYRSERTIYQWDIRNGSTKWVYETSKNNFVDPVIGDGGWATLTYTFADVDINGTELAGDTRFGIYFRGNFVEGDVFEIMDVKLNGEPLEIESTNIKSYATLEEETIADHVWNIPRNYAILLATGKPGDVDKHPLIAKVAPGSTVKELAEELEEDGGYIVNLYSDDAKTVPYDLSAKVLKDALIVYYERTGVERTVTFDLNGGTSATAIADAKVINGQSVAEPATIPTKEGELFAEWCTDKEGTKPYDFTKAVKDNLTLYARYGVPRKVTFDLNGAEGSIADVNVADGMTVARPTPEPTNGPYGLDDWYLGETVYDFSTPVTADIILRAEWSDKTVITIDLNYEGAPEATSFNAKLDTPLATDDANLKVETRIGYDFGGWYDEATCETAHDFTKDVTGPFTLYAKWTEATLYRLVASGNAKDNQYGKDKLAIVHSDKDVDDGDVLSFRFRTTRPFTFFSIRRAGGGNKWIYQNKDASKNYGFTTFETKEDGWTYVTYKFDKATAVDSSDIPAEDADFEIHFGNRWNDPSGNSGIVKGDILEIQGWAINGEPLEIAADDVTGYAGASLSTVAGGAYAWSNKTVSFNTGDAAAIDPIEVEYGQKLELPDDPVKEGSEFAGWYTDSEFAVEFDAESRIVEDITLYAKFGEAVTITFNGTDLEAVSILKGTKVTEPTPTKEGYVFGGWFKESTFDTEFDFDAAIDEDTVIYAKWLDVWTVTLDLNYGGKTEKVYVGKGSKMDEPKVARAGYYLDGWFTAAKDGDEFNFAETSITADTTIYAHWSEPTKYYEFTATKGGVSTSSQDKFVLTWNPNVKVEPGDILSFAFKSERLDGLTKDRSYSFSVRDAKKWFSEKTINDKYPQFFSTFEEGDDGWTYVTYVFPTSGTQQEISYPATFQLHFRDSTMADGTETGTIADKVYVKAVAVNGEALTLDKDRTKTLFSCPTIEEHDIEPVAPTVYVLTATVDKDRVQLAFPEAVAAGDVISFEYKTDLVFTSYGVRTKTSGDFCKNVAFEAGEPDDGWYTFSYTVPEGKSSTEFFITLNTTAKIGDVMRIRNFTVAGKELAIADSNDYNGIKATVTTE